ncbi:hypothetical protein ACLI1A_17240 [Flavobacterium sp. RHBU_3]|uniref:hypothetical protein n=1 Tax=Flavobacterium sp. RHBU_3 TaxID=3391184 RepID=UPI003984CE71
MKIGQKFNTLTFKEYFFYIDNHKKYTDFNTLGLYRSIIENEKLSLENKIEVRDYTHTFFNKSFDFLQLKDPYTFIKISTLGQELTKADEWQLWENLKQNQQKILNDKRIKHRNFGDYSKHSCGYENCPLNGFMVRQGGLFSEGTMDFKSDCNSYGAKEKSMRRKAERKNEKKIIKTELNNE